MLPMKTFGGHQVTEEFQKTLEPISVEGIFIPKIGTDLVQTMDSKLMQKITGVCSKSLVQLKTVYDTSCKMDFYVW